MIITVIIWVLIKNDDFMEAIFSILLKLVPKVTPSGILMLFRERFLLTTVSTEYNIIDHIVLNSIVSHKLCGLQHLSFGL